MEEGKKEEGGFRGKGVEEEIKSKRMSTREIYGRLNRDTRAARVQKAVVESSNVNGSLWIEFASELGIIALNIASLLFKSSLHYLFNSLPGRHPSIPAFETHTQIFIKKLFNILNTS